MARLRLCLIDRHSSSSLMAQKKRWVASALHRHSHHSHCVGTIPAAALSHADFAAGPASHPTLNIGDSEFLVMNCAPQKIRVH